MTLPASLQGLLTPEAYPHPADTIRLIETPISWVLLAGDFAYKIKRPVRLAFIDLTDPVHRAHLCEEEVRLNRRFAPQLYLGVCRVAAHDGAARIADGGPVLAHAVRMRRFPAEDELDVLLESGHAVLQELDAFGRELAQIHAGLAVAPAGTPWGQPAQVQALMMRNLAECAEAAAAFGQAAAVQALGEPLARLLPRTAAVMASRRAGGRVRECHGDLHCRNIVRLSGRLVAFDCLEYEASFRWIDVADEIAFLGSDLAARGRPEAAHVFISAYLEESGDYQACRVLKLYEAHRALVRAKVAALAAATAEPAQQEGLRREHQRLLAHAAGSLGCQAPLLILMQGLSGSGKTHLARQLAVSLRAVHLRSDIERKRHAGLAPLARADAGLYTQDSTAAVYAQLADAARDVLAGGFTVIVDATFLRREQRARFGELVQRCGVPVHLVSCEAPETVLRARVAARKAQGRDASDADEAVLDQQLSQQEPPASGEPFDLIRIDTTGRDAAAQVLAALGA